MRVLWFTHIPLQSVVERHGKSVSGTGFWLHSLVGPLRQDPDVTRLGVVWAGLAGCDNHFEADGVDYYTVAQSRWTTVYGIGRKRSEERCLKRFVKIIGEFKPDIIHIHGTERFYGLIKSRGLTNVPTVLSIQGLMGPYAKYAWGDKSGWDILKLQGKWDAIRGFPSLKRRSRFLDRAEREKEFLQTVDGVIGRTAWDRAYTWSVASNRQYFHVDEMMRPVFFSNQWSLSACNRHQVYTSGRLTFLKGMHTFLEAMALLKREYPDLSVRIAGTNTRSAQCRYLHRQTDKLGLGENVEFLGWIPGSEIVKELKNAHVYANASFIENGCNALQEAMLMAVPCVASFAGGMATTLEHRKTGLMFPRGNSFMLADSIRELFEDDELAKNLGQAAKTRATRRHAPQKILRDLLNCYRKILDTK